MFNSNLWLHRATKYQKIDDVETNHTFSLEIFCGMVWVIYFILFLIFIFLERPLRSQDPRGYRAKSGEVRMCLCVTCLLVSEAKGREGKCVISTARSKVKSVLSQVLYCDG